MTMRNPLDGEMMVVRPVFDPLKRYRFTWPGQSPKVVSGEEMASLCKGADPAMLDIQEDAAPVAARRSTKEEV